MASSAQPPSAPPGPPTRAGLLASIDALREQLDALGDAPPPFAPPPPPALSPLSAPPVTPPAAAPAVIEDAVDWHIIGPLLGVVGALLVLISGLVFFMYKRGHKLSRRRTLMAAQEMSSATRERRDTGGSEVQVSVDAANDEEERRRLREKLASVGGLGWSNTVDRVTSPTPAVPELEFNVEEAICAAGSADAALLAAVCRNANVIEVRSLLQQGANPDTSFINQSALSIAARLCSSQTTTALLEAGANIDMKDPQGWTALMHAIDAHSPTFSREGVLVQLLDAGAAVDVWGHDLRGPFELMEAKGKQHEDEGERPRLTSLMQLHKGPVSMMDVQLVPSDRSEDEDDSEVAPAPAAAAPPILERIFSGGGSMKTNLLKDPLAV